MDDPILAPEPAAAPVAPAAAPEPDRMDRLEAAMTELTRTVADAATRLTAPQAPAAVPIPDDEFLNRLAAHPQETIQMVARETFKAAADATLTPAVLKVLDTSSRQLMDAHRQRVDYEFGEGTFAEVFAPQLEKDLAQLRSVNPSATADPATLEALVNRMYGGDNFNALVERRKSAGAGSNRGSHYIPGGGIPRLRQAGGEPELPADVETFLRDVEKATGEQVDRKAYGKLYHTGIDMGPGRHRTTVVDYLKAVGANADTLKHYGG